MNNAVRTAGVVGYPIHHSLSPRIHGYWIARYGVAGRYEAFEIPPENFVDSVRALVANGVAGFNVTIPHKRAMMPLCATLDETATRIGAVNTVRVDADGALHGMNTDASGFAESLRESAPQAAVPGGAALVLGAGGAARAVVHALETLGFTDIRIANRTRAKADAIAAAFSVRAVDWDARTEAAANARVLVNATALGMDGMAPLDFDVAALPPDAVVCDIVYRPLETPLLRAARARGHATVPGTGMLLHQARPAFAAWFGILPDVTDELRTMVAGDTA